MGSTASSPASPEFLAAFRRHADANGMMSFAQFMQLALYDPEVGYYTRPHQRIGYGPGTDFFTASTSGSVFGELVAATCAKLLDDAADAYTFVEIGSEARSGVLAGLAHPFAATRTIRLADRMDISGKCVVFSNELFDAQPFNRFVFRSGRWHELGVCAEDDCLMEVEFAADEPPSELPASAPEGYVIDAPLDAARLAAQIAGQPWTGLFVAIDYGKSWREIAEAAPAGTARAYFRHTQSNELLARAGEQDLTCHICWDWIAEALEQHGFQPPELESQEAFFIRHGCEVIAQISEADASRFSRRKQSLAQLLHPAHLGRKFEVLHARRA